MPQLCPRSSALAMSAFVLLLVPSAVLAAWTHDPVANLPVCVQGNNQDGYSIAEDGSGGMFVAWNDNRAGTHDIYATHVLASGVVDPAWPANGLLICTATGDQTGAALLPDGVGGALVAWTDGRFFGAGGVYAHHLLATGVDPSWPVDGRALVSGAGLGGSPVRVISDGSGGLIAAWPDFRNGTLDIYAQHLQASGLVDPVWPATGSGLCTATGHQLWPQMVSDGAGGAIVTWEDLRGANSDIFAHRVLAGGAADPAWPVNGRAICTATGSQPQPQICSDNSGGAIIIWGDPRSGTSDIYAQRVLASGAVDPAWPVDGRVLCNAAAAQDGPLILSDGSGGGLAVWSDARNGATRDIYATRVMSYGLTHPSWPVNGLAVHTASGSQYVTSMVSDGANGAILLWSGQDGAPPDIQALHLRISGVVDPWWPADGSTLCSAPGTQALPVGVPDGLGGALVLWQDSRAVNTDLYAQRVARSGEIGVPEPVILSVTDVPNDQGGQVKLSWDASYLDYESLPPLVDTYRIYRSVPPNGAAAASRAPASRALGAAEHSLLAALAVATGTAWEFVAAVPAENVSFITRYSYVAPTLSDSTGGSNPSTEFLVAAFNAAGDRYWYSESGSGYSVDNLAPATPAPFTAAYAGGATHLHWGPNVEADFATYRLYRGSSPGFVPGPANLVASPADTGYADAGAAGSYYKLSAVDTHGNESGYALIGPNNTAGDVPSSQSRLELARPEPNPAIASTVLRFAVPADQRVRLVLFDLSGRAVRVLVDRVVPAGAHGAVWDLRDAGGGQVANGIYFARLETSGRALVQRLVVTR